MNLHTLRLKQISWKVIVLIILVVLAGWGVYQAGIAAGDWLVRYLDLDHVSAVPPVHLK